MNNFQTLAKAENVTKRYRTADGSVAGIDGDYENQLFHRLKDSLENGNPIAIGSTPSLSR